MTDGLAQPGPIGDALAALAVLGRADKDMLEAVLGFEESSEFAQPLSADRWTALINHPAVTGQDRWLTLESEAASNILDQFEQQDAPRYRQYHHRAVAYLGSRLDTDSRLAEETFIVVFERLAGHLLLEDHKQLGELVESVRTVTLATPRNRHLRQYFEGLVLGLNDNYTAALAAFDALLAEPNLEDLVRGRALNSRSVFCRTLGRFEEALTGYQTSLELWRRLDHRLNEGKALVNMGILAYELRRYDEAESNLTQAECCFEEVNATDWLPFVQNERGLVYRDQGRFEEALACFEGAATGYKSEYKGLAQNNIGEVLLFQGHLEKAKAAFQQALANLRTDTYRVDGYLHLGLVAQASHSFLEARTAFEKALDLALAINRREILAEVHYRLGDVLRQLGQAEAALNQFRAGVAVIEASREPLRDEGLKISLLGRWQQLYEALILHLVALDRPEDAFAVAERARARAFGDAVARCTAPGSSGSHPEDMLQNQPVSTPVTVSEAQANLPVNSALLCYFTIGVLDQDLPLLGKLSPDNPVREQLLLPAQILLFVLTRDKLLLRECPIDPNAFVSDSPRHEDRQRFLSNGVPQSLHKILLEPAGEALVVDKLFIVPHGPLHQVPFGAAINPDNAPLIRAGGPQVAYAPSVSVLLQHGLMSDSPSTPAGMCLAIGYDGRSDAYTLRHTEMEAAFVADLTRGKALVGSQPKLDRLRREVSGYDWLHFACHGHFNSEAPLDSFLEIGLNERLTAADILQNWRLAAELVVLSACQTGVSRILRGDEPMGLIRAFMLAGAKTVLVTQWPVEDLPTFLLMRRFYTELQSQESTNPASALHAAQIWLRELSAIQVQQVLDQLQATDSLLQSFDPLAGSPSGARPFAHPRYWAAFNLVGKL